MTPFHIRRNVKKALTSLPGPLGGVVRSVLGGDREEAGRDASTDGGARTRATPAEPRSHAPDLAPDPRGDRDDEGGRPPAPKYTPEEEAVLKASKPSPRDKGQENVIYWQVAKRSDLPPGTGKVVKALDREYALFNVDGEFHAIDNACPHANGPLGQGVLEGRIVTCNDHGWTFDVTTGECVSRPGNRVEKVPVRYDGERILLPT